jgi:hypothetical protein
VLEPKFDSGGRKRSWKQLLLSLALAGSLILLTSCGSNNSSSTTATPSVLASCAVTQVTVLGTSQCSATVSNLSSTLVTWTISGTGTGSIDSKSGLYTAPSTVPTNNVVTVTATSQAQTTVTGTTTITIEPAVAIASVTCLPPGATSQPSPLIVASGETLDCTATATGGATVLVNWTVTNANMLGGNVGSISLGGAYTAPLVPPPGQTITITATSQTLTTNSMSITATVVFGNNVLSGPYVFSTTGRVANSSNAFFARVGSLTAGGGTLIGVEDTHQAGASGGFKQQVAFTGSYSVYQDGRGMMQFCEVTGGACPLGSPATAFFHIVVQSPQRIQIIDFGLGTRPATITSAGEMLAQDQSVFGAGVGNLAGTYSFNFAGISNASAEQSAVGEFTASGVGLNSVAAIFADSPTTPGRIDTDAAGATTLAASTYSISSGRGSMTLNTSAPATLVFSFYVVSASQSKFLESDSSGAILVGDAFKQQASATCAWGLNALKGSAVFETFGASSGVAIADVGSFTASNNGTTGAVSAGSIDENSGGSVSSQIGTLSGGYSVDSCGRGTLTIGSHSYVFYVVSAAKAVLQETTSGIVAHGSLVQPTGGPFMNSSLSGSYALSLSGTNAAGAAGQRQDIVGQLTADGAGAVKSGSLDINSFGPTQTGVAISGTYAPNPTGSLRAKVPSLMSTPAVAMPQNLVLYLVSPTQFYALDTDATGTAVGTLDNQF